MGVLSKILRDQVTPEGVKWLSFWCPGCKTSHTVSVGQNGTWGWNGNVDKPTFSPSMLVRSGHFASIPKPNGKCWCTYNTEQKAKGEKPSRFTCGVCHSFVANGRIQFLSDCTHELAGQTVDLPDYQEATNG